MTDQKTGCRVLDKGGNDETASAYWDTGYAEWMAVDRATAWAAKYPSFAPYRVVVYETLHTIHATPEEG